MKYAGHQLIIAAGIDYASTRRNHVNNSAWQVD